MIYKKIIFLVILVNFLAGCQSLKDGLEGTKKSKKAEEFLIQKKNPLVLPPDFDKLPVPENSSDLSQEDEFDLKKILKSEGSTTNTENQTNSSLEKSIIDTIKKK
tara:strand:+ start:365 stop:679 length:315 start_codon:yes stop_codon:yes gene_type:complete